MGTHHPVIEPLECKGCGRCVHACPKGVLRMSEGFNARGYRFSVYRGDGCVGCGVCFYTCPEPFALRVEDAEEAEALEEQSAKGEL